MNISPSRGSLALARGGHTDATKIRSEEELLWALREVEAGETAVAVCRRHEISQQTRYQWKRKSSGLGLSELRELRQLREENAKLKWLVADLSLDRHILQEIVGKKLCSLAPSAPRWRRCTLPTPPASAG